MTARVLGMSLVTITDLASLRVIFCSKEVVLPVLMMNLMASGPSVSYRGTTTME